MDDQNSSFFASKLDFYSSSKVSCLKRDFAFWIYFFPEIRPSLTTKLHKNENIFDEFRLNV